MNLVCKSLMEFVHPGVGGYSMDQLERDYNEILKRNFDPAQFSPKEAKAFFVNVIIPPYERGEVQTINDVNKLVMGDQPILEVYEENEEGQRYYYDDVLGELEEYLSPDQYSEYIQYNVVMGPEILQENQNAAAASEMEFEHERGYYDEVCDEIDNSYNLFAKIV